MGITQQIGASSIIKPGVIDNTAARPASPYEGQVIFQKDTDQLLVWNGTAWVIPNSPAQNPQGLELITTCTVTSGGTASNGVVTVGSAVSSVVIANAFSSTYDNYRIMYIGGSASAQNDLSLKLGSTTSGYYLTMIYKDYGGGGVTGQAVNNGSQWTYVGAQDNPNQAVVDLGNPFNAIQTTVFGNYIGAQSGRVGGVINGFLNNTTSYSAFTIGAGSGTITGGTIRVYGYRNS
jgi:hypothetical protein